MPSVMPVRCRLSQSDKRSEFVLGGTLTSAQHTDRAK